MNILFELKEKKTPVLVFYDTTESVLNEARKLIYSLKKKNLMKMKILKKIENITRKK